MWLDFENEMFDINIIKVFGGFRCNFLRCVVGDGLVNLDDIEYGVGLSDW